MADFFSSRLLRWLTIPARSRMVNMASRPFTQVADKVLGAQFLGDVTEFFLLFQSMYDGFVERSQAVQRLLRDRRTTFVVVTTLDSAPAREAEFLLGALAERQLHPGGLVLNRVLPDYFLDAAAGDAAERLRADPAAAAKAVFGDDDEAAAARVLAEVAESFLNFRVVASRQAEQRAELGRLPDAVAAVPYIESEVTDLAGLLAFGRQLWGRSSAS